MASFKISDGNFIVILLSRYKQRDSAPICFHCINLEVHTQSSKNQASMQKINHIYLGDID